MDCDFPSKIYPAKLRRRSANTATSVTITSFSRPVLHFRVQPRAEHEPVHVYVCHLKSKKPSEVSREAWFRADPGTYRKHQSSLGAALSRGPGSGGGCGRRWRESWGQHSPARRFSMPKEQKTAAAVGVKEGPISLPYRT